MSAFTESVVEEAALDWLAALGYSVLSGAVCDQRDAGRFRRRAGADRLDRRGREWLSQGWATL